MPTQIRFGMVPTPLTAPYAAVLARSRRAVELGFDGLWFADETPMAYPDESAMDAWLLMAAIARDLPGPTLGSLVTAAIYRHPLLNAVNVSTLDHISNGRAILGMGAGGVPADLDGLGAGGTPGRELVERLDEQLDSIDRLLRGETVTRETGFHPMKDAAGCVGVCARHSDHEVAAGVPALRGPGLPPAGASSWHSRAPLQ
jgi:alkanesulfonate monooxygenase SsuD/methylene tetrahydromethanopterin reductase-like flavin-dependent oxidoreductase (luciferase family)